METSVWPTCDLNPYSVKKCRPPSTGMADWFPFFQTGSEKLDNYPSEGFIQSRCHTMLTFSRSPSKIFMSRLFIKFKCATLVALPLLSTSLFPELVMTFRCDWNDNWTFFSAAEYNSANEWEGKMGGHALTGAPTRAESSWPPKCSSSASPSSLTWAQCLQKNATSNACCTGSTPKLDFLATELWFSHPMAWTLRALNGVSKIHWQLKRLQWIERLAHGAGDGFIFSGATHSNLFIPFLTPPVLSWWIATVRLPWRYEDLQNRRVREQLYIVPAIWTSSRNFLLYRSTGIFFVKNDVQRRFFGNDFVLYQVEMNTAAVSIEAQEGLFWSCAATRQIYF